MASSGNVIRVVCIEDEPEMIDLVRLILTRNTGDTTYEVLEKCGVPDYREIEFARETEDRLGRRTVGTRVIRIKAGMKYDGASSGNEKWYYDPGPTCFCYFIIFGNSRVHQIKRRGYGSSKGIADWNVRKAWQSDQLLSLLGG